MTRGDEYRLADINDAAAKLATRISATDYQSWVANEDLRLVTERLVEIIGEAARAMTAEGRAAHPDVDWTGLIGLRNVLVHAYHRIQPDLLWQVASVDVPDIVAALQLGESPPDTR